MSNNTRFIYFGIEHAVATHDWIIDNSGGRHGLIDEGLLSSPLEMIKNDLYYPTIVEKLTHLVYSINKNHAFNDGNKRSSLALGAYFLELNGYDYIVNYFIIEMENIAVWVADNAISKELLSEIISDLINMLELSDKTKLKILNCVSAHR
ncbi:type II toxin-antitoxin system death-on-curing family toxin [Morganella morganii]|nr:type II toxin-antitoxin system death-on-curing family toxin [Morganella morganii]